MKYSIVIPTYNHCNDLLRPCIESILRYTNLTDIELIISANGCTDNTNQYINHLRSIIPENHLKIAWNDTPLGYAKATNAGIKLATCDKIVLLNNDIVLLQQEKNQWLSKLEENFLINKKCGITCLIKQYSPITNKEFAIFFCVMINKTVFNRIGLLNEMYDVGSSEDIDFCAEAEEAGFDIMLASNNTNQHNNLIVGDFPLYHKGEGTVHDTLLVKDWNKIFHSNLLKLAKKYNYGWFASQFKIAVITPLFNDQLIVNAIESVKQQTFKNVCHYVYDDNSSEDIKQLLLNYQNNKNIFIKFSKENTGQSNGRNFLIEQALRDNCTHIAFLDSDDTWDPTHLEENIKFLDSYNIVYSRPKFIFNNGDVAEPFNIPEPTFFIGKQLEHNNFIWISSVIADINLFKQNKFDSELDSLEDWDMWYRLYKQNAKFIKNNKTTVTYLVKTQGQASLGTIKREKFNKKHNTLLQLKLHLACGHDYQPEYINLDFYAPDTAKIDVKFDVKSLPYDNNVIDEIRAFHIIEHFDFFEGQEVLKEWHRVLKPGGRLWIETPDFLETCKSFVSADEDFRVLLYGHFFAHPWVPGQTHKFLFTETQLITQLKWAGFNVTNRLSPSSNYVLPHTAHLFLNIEAFK